MISDNPTTVHSQKSKQESDPEQVSQQLVDLAQFSKATSIIKDIKTKNTLDIIRIKQKLDEKPHCFDFGSGIILVYRFQVETVDAEINLYVPAINSFVKKIEVGKFYRIHSKRSFHYEVYEDGINEWILYVNRIKNISMFNMSIKQRMAWRMKDKSKPIKFGFDENWLEKSLPIDNNLDNTKQFLESPKDITRDNLLSPPIKILRLEFIQQLEFLENSGSIIKNLEYSALLHNNKVIKLFVPYFLKDIISSLSENLLTMNLIVNKLKLFTRGEHIGFLWDCTLSGFIFISKLYEEKLMSIKDGVEFFFGSESEEFIKFIWRSKLKNKNQKNNSSNKSYKKREFRK